MAKNDDLSEQALQSLREQVERWQKQADAARQQGNHDLIRQSLERKRHAQNRLALMYKALAIDEQQSNT